jgi:hypothetical protein
MHQTAAAIAAVAILAGCENRQNSGDGQLSDAGPFTAHNRYFLDLGPVDLAKPGSHVYRLSQLPEKEFTIGLYTSMTITPSGNSLWEAKPLSADVRITLREGSSEVFDTVDNLRNWTWNEAVDLYTFIYYRPGTGRSVSGTYFSARKNSDYRLTIEILTPDLGASPYDIHLVAMGGGWK